MEQSATITAYAGGYDMTSVAQDNRDGFKKSPSAPHSFRDGVEGKVCGEGRRAQTGMETCGKWHPLVEFPRNYAYEDGHALVCKHCKKKSLVKHKSKRQEAAPSHPSPELEVRADYALMTYQGVSISFEPDCSAVCITEMWRASDSPENKRPNDWLALSQTKELLAQYASDFDAASNGIRLAQRNGIDGRGTWLPRELALAYAHYLSPALYLACNRFVLNRGQSQQAPAQLREMLRDAMKDTARELMEEFRPWWSNIKDIHHETIIEVRGVVYVCKYPRLDWPDADTYYGMGWDRYAIGWTTKLLVDDRLKEYPGKYDIARPEEVCVIKTDNNKLETLIHERRPRQGVYKVPHKRDVFWLSSETIALLKALPGHLGYDEAKRRLYQWGIVRKGSDITW
jgi:hypothetical protein